MLPLNAKKCEFVKKRPADSQLKNKKSLMLFGNYFSFLNFCYLASKILNYLYNTWETVKSYGVTAVKYMVKQHVAEFRNSSLDQRFH